MLAEAKHSPLAGGCEATFGEIKSPVCIIVAW